MSEAEGRQNSGLVPQYRSYTRQKCFIAYSEGAPWAEDLLAACQEVLSRPEFDLEPDHARRHFDPDVPLRQKALELIANARYGIYDLSYWQDARGEWQMPRNVLIELGMAIALNRPALLLRHKSNCVLELPECLKSVSMLQFSGEKTLKDALVDRLPQWINTPPERDWWNRYCHFGGRVCEFREAHPRARQWGKQEIRCHISDGPDVDQTDFRGLVQGILERYKDVEFDYLDRLSLCDGYQFVLCSHCQVVRSTPFAIYRITLNTPAETFIAIGMSTTLERQFEYRIPKILLTEGVRDVPSLLTGYEVGVARNDKERKNCLLEFIPEVVNKVLVTNWKPKPLPFTKGSVIEDKEQDIAREPLSSPEPPANEDTTTPPSRRGARLRGSGGMRLIRRTSDRVPATRRILVADDDTSIPKLLQVMLKEPHYEIVAARNGLEALKVFESGLFDVVILDVMMPYMDGFEVCQRIRERSDVPIVFLTSRDNTDDVVHGFELGADDYISKPFKTDELIARVESILRHVEGYKYRIAPPIVRVGELVIDKPDHRVTVRGQEIKLTPMEFELLYFLAANPGQVFDRETLFREVWGYDYVGETNLVDVCVRRLREKVEVEPARPRIIVTVRGVGYKLAGG
jgi:DNA-binding response OmpR family regulator